jgi:hypothetical protein
MDHSVAVGTDQGEVGELCLGAGPERRHRHGVVALDEGRAADSVRLRRRPCSFSAFAFRLSTRLRFRSRTRCTRVRSCPSRASYISSPPKRSRGPAWTLARFARIAAAVTARRAGSVQNSEKASRSPRPPRAMPAVVASGSIATKLASLRATARGFRNFGFSASSCSIGIALRTSLSSRRSVRSGLRPVRRYRSRARISSSRSQADRRDCHRR